MIRRVLEFFTSTDSPMSKTVRTTATATTFSQFRRETSDWSRADYDFWRRAIRCRVRGLEISGLFLKPLVNKIAAWVLGMPPRWKLENQESSEALDEWWSDNHAEILKAYRASLRQGDSFIVINPDLTITILRPDNVDPIVAEDDYGEIIGWRVTQILTHPTRSTDKMTVVDEYYITHRLHTVEVSGVLLETTTYPNVIGRLPIIHIPNQSDDGESFGHAEAEALVETLHRYGVVIEAAIEGNRLQGRPTPVAKFETVADLDKFWDTYGSTQTQELVDGTIENIEVLDIDLSQMLTLSGGEFHYESPGSFTADTERLLGLLFYLILEHTELPEFVFGNAIASSQASAETQMPIFESFIRMRRSDAGGWLAEIAQTALAYLTVIIPGAETETPNLQWKVLSQDGRLTLETLQWALTEGLIDERTALMLSPLDVDDIDEVLETAREEREARDAERQAQLPEQFDQDLADEIEELEI